MFTRRCTWRRLFGPMLVSVLLLTACGQPAGTDAGTDAGNGGGGGGGGGGTTPTLYIGGIPDQDRTVLDRRFHSMAEYLAEETGLTVKYVPAADYAAVVTAFKRGDLHLAWFGGLTGVQARAQAPGSQAVAQRPEDAGFHSIFIVQSKLPVQMLTDLKGLTFSFGSESSTSGHLMPRHYLLEAGVNPEQDFKSPPNFSGSHDKTIKLVESGAFQAGAVNESVWKSRVEQGEVDGSKVRAFYTTPAYYDYNWSLRPDIDGTFGIGARDKIVQALLDLDATDGEAARAILEAFNTEKFIATNNDNYQSIAQVAERLGIIK